MDVSGTYEGFYEYGAGYMLPEFGKRVKMRVEIQEENGVLRGTVSEEKTELSVHHPAKIEGHIEEHAIYFIKNYLPQTIDYAEVLDAASWNQSDFSPIDHGGYIDRENKCLYGDWYIESFLEKEDGTKEDNPYYFRGIWFLSRASN